VSPARNRRRLSFWQWSLIAVVVVMVLVYLGSQTLVPAG
jgi:hypothetical protein